MVWLQLHLCQWYNPNHLHVDRRQKEVHRSCGSAARRWPELLARVAVGSYLTDLLDGDTDEGRIVCGRFVDDSELLGRRIDNGRTCGAAVDDGRSCRAADRRRTDLLIGETGSGWISRERFVEGRGYWGEDASTVGVVIWLGDDGRKLDRRSEVGVDVSNGGSYLMMKAVKKTCRNFLLNKSGLHGYIYTFIRRLGNFRKFRKSPLG